MVFKFRLLSHEIKDFVMDIEILAKQTFYDFHKAIQDELNYDSSQIASFFQTNQLWEKEKEFILFDISDVPNDSTIVMDRARLRDFIKDPKQRLIYIFDVFNERGLFIELIDTLEENRYSDYPAVVYSKGVAPPQIQFGSRDFGAILDEENSSFDFEGQDDDDAKIGLPGEIDTNETGDLTDDDSSGLNDDEPSEFIDDDNDSSTEQ